MTITIAWVRQNKNTSELLVASDSRLRAYGAIDQAQKLFRLERGDCCLGFCGDAQVAYPLFVQVGTTLNNFVRTRTRAEDITDITDTIGRVLNNLIGSWDLPEADKADQLTSTRILFSGWSWKHRRFDIGFFMADGCTFNFHHRKMRISHPWHENRQSLVFIGDYEREYRSALNDNRAAARRRCRHKGPAAHGRTASRRHCLRARESVPPAQEPDLPWKDRPQGHDLRGRA